MPLALSSSPNSWVVELVPEEVELPVLMNPLREASPPGLRPSSTLRLSLPLEEDGLGGTIISKIENVPGPLVPPPENCIRAKPCREPDKETSHAPPFVRTGEANAAA